MQVSEALDAALTLAERLGATPLNKHAACWEAQIDEHWWIAINAHRETLPCSKGVPVKPFTMYIECNGMPCGFVNPHHGAIIGFGSEDALIEALKEAQRRIA